MNFVTKHISSPEDIRLYQKRGDVFSSRQYVSRQKYQFWRKESAPYSIHQRGNPTEIHSICPLIHLLQPVLSQNYTSFAFIHSPRNPQTDTYFVGAQYLPWLCCLTLLCCTAVLVEEGPPLLIVYVQVGPFRNKAKKVQFLGKPLYQRTHFFLPLLQSQFFPISYIWSIVSAARLLCFCFDQTKHKYTDHCNRFINRENLICFNGNVFFSLINLVPFFFAPVLQPGDFNKEPHVDSDSLSLVRLFNIKLITVNYKV
ncbi:hypothetical protein FKM82_008154 [Ascaphus truei]